MKILIAPDSFKGTFTAAEVARAIGSGVRSANVSPLFLPVADGGEGTEEILGTALGACRIHVDTVGPWRDPVRAAYSMTQDGTAYINLAAASGITLPAPKGRNPRTADTYGTGLLMVDAIARGATKLVLAAGGSATTDGGSGACSAIVDHGGLNNATLLVLSDVTTPFEEAAAVFGPQKGATPDEVALLTQRLHEQASRFPKDPRGIPSTGAAGGFSGGLWAHFGAELRSGADYVLDSLGFDAAVAQADAVVVGEGRLDSQTLQGKIISAIVARSGSTPIYAVVGSVTDDAPIDAFTRVFVAPHEKHMVAAGLEVAADVLRSAT